MCCVGIKSRTRGALSGSVPEGERLQQVLWNIYAWASSCFLGPILYISLCVSVYVVVCVHTEGNKEGESCGIFLLLLLFNITLWQCSHDNTYRSA